MKNLLKKIQNASYAYDLWNNDSKIILGVSGGPDSACLLDIFCRLKEKYPLELAIAHVNYGLRGADSEKDEEFVRKLAEKYALKIHILKPAVHSKINLEEKLREIRYDFFEKMRQENGFDLIAVAHNSDDQTETFLMRVLRGSGLAGLGAMRHKNGKIIRPLLSISRQEILEYLKERDLRHRTDKTNKTDLFLRNKIRNKLIPYLENNFNPNIRKTISDATISIAEDYSLISETAEKFFMKNKDLSVKKLSRLHPSLLKQVLLRAAKRIDPDMKDIEAGFVEEMTKIVRSTKNKPQIVVSKRLKLTRKGDKVTISKP